jgi:hypothetical protein
MLNYIIFIFASIILLFLFHYIYDKIKESIIYCDNYLPIQNFKNTNELFPENINKETS